MMVKRLIALILMTVLISTGCGLAGSDVREEDFERLDIAAWPTPEPTDTPRPQPRLIEVDLARLQPPTPASSPTLAVAARPAGDDGPGVTGRPLASTDVTLNLVGVATIADREAVIRTRPQTDAGAIETLAQGELVGVFGRDQSGRWIYIQAVSETMGWLAYHQVYALDTLADAPVLPPDPASLVNSSGKQRDSTAHDTHPAALQLSQLNPVTSGAVNVSALNMRRRPGPDYQRVAVLSGGNEVSILALNRDERWALVETAAGQFGWVSKPYLDVSGSLANAPVLRTLPPAEAQQTAPIVLASSANTPAQAASAAQLAGQPTAAPPQPTAASRPPLPNDTLSVKTTARVNRNIDLRRGPSTGSGVIVGLNDGEPVTVHAVNSDRDWVVVRTTDSGTIGWTRRAAVDLESSLPELAPVISGWIESNELMLRNGPGIVYGEIGPVAIYDLVSVLAMSEDRNWLLLETLAGGEGWLPRSFVDLTGPAGIPVIASPPLPAGAEPALPPLDAAPPPRTGQLTIQTGGSGGLIKLIDADGSNLRTLTAGIDPVLSPDGRRVAFTRWVGDIGALWVINTDGSGERQILGQMRKAKGPAWSPDGQQVVVNFQQGGRPQEKRTCHDLAIGVPRGATDIEVSVDKGEDPKICFTLAPDPYWILRVINVSDGSFEDYGGGTYAFRPTWDPARPQRLVSDGGRGLVATNLTLPEKEQQRLTDNVNDSSPVFSPDGRYIAMTFGKPGGSKGYNIYRLDASGGGRMRLTETPFWLPLQPESLGVQWNNVAPAWSPDGSQIAFLTDRENRWEIWLMNADGSNQRPMFSREISDQLALEYNFVDERILSWQ